MALQLDDAQRALQTVRNTTPSLHAHFTVFSGTGKNVYIRSDDAPASELHLDLDTSEDQESIAPKIARWLVSLPAPQDFTARATEEAL